MKSNSRPEIPIAGNYIKTGGGYIKNENKKFYRETKHKSKLKRLNKRHFNEKINSKVYFNVFRGATLSVCTISSNLPFIRTKQIRC